MSLLRSIESRLTSLVEGAFGKVFRSGVQPVELARRLTGEMDDHQRPTMHQVFVPNAYDVFLSTADHSRYADVEGALTAELAEYLAEHARRRGYALATRPRVRFHHDADLDLGSFGIRVQTESVSATIEPAASSAAPSTPVAAETTAIAPAPDPAPLELEVAGTRHRIDTSCTPFTLGRGKANAVVVSDSSVSRTHAEISRRGPVFVIRDLDSTNGLMANGSQVTEHSLAVGDRILLGSATLVVHASGPA